MKKVIIGVCAVLIILSANMAKAISVTPESLYGPLEPVWRAIDNLQKQIKNIRLTPGPQGPQGEPGPAGASLKVYDANNQEIGLVIQQINNSAEYKIWDFNLQKYINVFFENGNLDVINNYSYYFESNDCSGQVLVNEFYYPYEVYGASGEHQYLDWNYFVIEDWSDIRYDVQVNSMWSDDQGTCVNYNAVLDRTAIASPITTPTYAVPLRISQQ